MKNSRMKTIIVLIAIVLLMMSAVAALISGVQQKEIICSKFFMIISVNLLVFLVLALAAMLLYYYIVLPFRQYSASIKAFNDGSFELLKPSGSRETRMFAMAFNQIYGQWKQQQERLEKERFRFRVAVENTSVVIFEYDIDGDILSSYGTLDSTASRAAGIPMELLFNNFMKNNMEGLVDENYESLMMDLMTYSIPGPCEVRIHPYPGSDSYVWGRVRTVPIYDSEGVVRRIIGKITNIDTEKAREFEINDIKSRDKLTRLYNKDEGIHKVREFMENKSPDMICGMMLLDMDDFTALNREEGIVFADAVLQETADVLRAMTDPDDILVRLGGDEFMLFVKNCDKKRATILGPEIAAAVRKLTADGEAGPRVTASIGMCVTEVVDEYNALYRCSESTLKYVKANCKGTAACYLDTSNELGAMLTQVYPEHHFINEIDVTTAYERDNLITFALELLGRTKRLDDSIFLLLTRIGRKCRVDRVAITEFNWEYRSFHVTCQWTKNPMDRIANKVHYLDLREAERVIKSYDSDGICRHYLSFLPDKAASCIHAAIYDRGIYAGAMIMEIWQADYEWTEEQAKFLAELSKVISSFLLKAKADAVSSAKGEFLSRMSHEIRTPMNAITGMTAIAKASLDDKTKTMECLEKIETANGYLMELINDILDMSKIESGKIELKYESVSLDRMAEELDAMMRTRTDEKKLRFFICNGYEGQPPVMADSLRLNQVLINIIGNATKFTPEGGTIIFSIEPEAMEKDTVRLRFTVSDTGIGISAEARERIFKAFEQAEKDTALSFGGTGLGLAISDKLVRIMGGSLEVISEAGIGSEFYFSLEFNYANETTADVDDAIQAEAVILEDWHILLVEDNDLNREIAETLLTMNGVAVECAVNGAEAVSMFSHHETGYYDAILMDIRMPVMDGFEATRRIRTMGKTDSHTVPVIAMTANAFDEDTRKSFEAGMNGHLAKPIDISNVLEMLKNCINKSKRVSG